MWGEAGPHPVLGVYGPEISRENQFSVSEIDTKEEEVDARLLLHENHYLQSTFSSVIIYSPSGDTDVLVLAIALLRKWTYRYMENIRNILDLDKKN